MFEPVSKDNDTKPVIKVIGVGGGGCNAVEHIQDYLAESENEHNVELYAVNTDVQALRKSKVMNTLQIGKNVTRGLG